MNTTEYNVADECLTAVYYYRHIPDAEISMRTIRTAARMMAAVGECIGAPECTGNVSLLYDMNEGYQCCRLGRMKCTREDIEQAISGVAKKFNNLNMHISGRKTLDAENEALAELDVADCEHGVEVFVRDNLGHTKQRVRSDGTIILTVRSDRIRIVRPEARKALVADLCSTAAEIDCYYGHIECEVVSESGAGRLYGHAFNGPYYARPIIRELAWWHPLTSRNNLARGVYWGNYFGREFAAMLDRHGILEQFENYKIWDITAEKMLDSKSRVQRYGSGAAFASLTSDPLESSFWASEMAPIVVGCHARDRDDPYLMLAAWLHCKLRSIDAML